MEVSFPEDLVPVPVREAVRKTEVRGGGGGGYLWTEKFTFQSPKVCSYFHSQRSLGL